MSRKDQLKAREIEIVRLMELGLTDREIAQRLSLSVNTIKWYNKRIYSVLDVSGRTEAVHQARQLGYLRDGDLGPDSSPESPMIESTLPSQVNSFIGRRQDLQRALDLLRKNRLLTIIGPGGIGKTRLSLQLVNRLNNASLDSVYFVPLEAVSKPESLIWAIAEEIGIRFEPEHPALEQLSAFFSQQKSLIILDGFEVLLAAKNVVASLLESTPQLRILVTSRERLNLYGEATYRLGGLGLAREDDPAAALQSESVQLFRERAAAVNPSANWDEEDLRFVSRICRLVEGLPLAIELAATWSDVLRPKDMLDEIQESLEFLETQLEGLPSGESSMRITFERSWSRLEPDQQTALRRLSVFRGGFSRESAEAVADVSLRSLQILVNKSLVRYDPATDRYDIHELLRQYAEQRLESSEDFQSTQRSHASFFGRFLAERWPLMKGGRQHPTLLEVDEEFNNALTAWEYWIEEQEVQELAKFLPAFWVIHDIRGWYPSGASLLDEAISVLRTDDSEDAQAWLGWVLAVKGLFTATAGYRSREGFELARKGVELLRALGRNSQMIVPLISLFVAAVRVGEEREADKAARDCLLVAEELGDEWAMAKGKQLLASRAIVDQDYGRAKDLAQESLKIFEQREDRWSESILCIEVLGLLAISLRDYQLAEQWVQRGLAAAEQIDFQYAIQSAYWQLGYIQALQENFTAAGKFWKKALKSGKASTGGMVMMGFGGSAHGEDWGLSVLQPDSVSSGGNE